MPRARDLPVDPERLRRQFPTLTDDDLAAYAEVTRMILDEPRPLERARLTRAFLTEGRMAREKTEAGTPLTARESLAMRYVAAMEKMQV
jgi:hypothetical protein